MFERKNQIILMLTLIIIVTSKSSSLNLKNNDTITSIVQNKTLNVESKDESIVIKMNYKINKRNLIIISLISIALLLLLSLIYSFWKVPLKKGYSCRCCQRTKYFCKGLISLIFLPVTIIYYLINGLFGFLDGVFPDTRLEDCKLDEVDDNDKSKKEFMELQEERH